ncbi:protein FAM228B-like [Oscarella lobularis]|uniref:protein FAM228B-like n=1 Tax=Oscarella lobularis TaxID=121494 RepID=UPI00331433E0
MASAAGKIIVYHDEQKAQLLLDGLLHKSDKEQKQQRQEEEQGLCNASAKKSSSSYEVDGLSCLKAKLIRNIRRGLETGKVDEYSELLADENSFVREIDEYLKQKDRQDTRKREALYKKWKERVFDPVYAQVSSCMEREYGWFEMEKRHLFEKYLDYRNAKGFIFLDTYSEDEYNPFFSAAYPKALHHCHARDPLLSQERQRTAEEHVVRSCQLQAIHKDNSDEKRRTRSRSGTECLDWLTVELVTINSETRQKSRQRMKAMTGHHRTTIDFKTWSETEPKPNDEELLVQH